VRERCRRGVRPGAAATCADVLTCLYHPSPPRQLRECRRFQKPFLLTP